MERVIEVIKTINYAELSKISMDEYEIMLELLKDRIFKAEENLESENYFKYIAMKSLCGKIEAVLNIEHSKDK